MGSSPLALGGSKIKSDSLIYLYAKPLSRRGSGRPDSAPAYELGKKAKSYSRFSILLPRMIINKSVNFFANRKIKYEV
jgi:hypothetical protein